MAITAEQSRFMPLPTNYKNKVLADSQPET